MVTMDSRLTKRVLEFWFCPKDSDTYGKNLKIWWKKDPDFDEEVAARFRDHFEGAERGALDGLADDARGSLALVILLDQFPRNMFRGTARAFGTDAKALAISEKAIERGFDRTLIPAERAFLYMPWQHVESLDVQERSVRLFEALDFGKMLDFAIRHRDIIARFGRFPHRNHIVGRDSTAEEREFLKLPDSSF